MSLVSNSQDSLITQASTSVGAAIEAPPSCIGKNTFHNFTCDVNDCSKRGLVAVEHGVCRCDGCILRGGRCGGWTFLGRHRPLNNSAAVCASGTYNAAAPTWPDAPVTYSLHEDLNPNNGDVHPSTDVIMLPRTQHRVRSSG